MPSRRMRGPDTYSPCWMLNKRYHGKGYAYEAAHAFFDYLFLQKGARRVYAYTEADNLSSQRLCRRLGMRQEGLFKEFISFVDDENGDPVYEDTMEWAILRKEWLSGRTPRRARPSGTLRQALQSSHRARGGSLFSKSKNSPRPSSSHPSPSESFRRSLQNLTAWNPQTLM